MRGSQVECAEIVPHKTFYMSPVLHYHLDDTTRAYKPTSCKCRIILIAVLGVRILLTSVGLLIC